MPFLISRHRNWARAVLFTGLLGLASSALARDYYVDSHAGNDGNEGNQEHPFRTLAPLLQRLTACDNAYVRIPGAANDSGVGRYSHAEMPGSAACLQVAGKH